MDNETEDEFNTGQIKNNINFQKLYLEILRNVLKNPKSFHYSIL